MHCGWIGYVLFIASHTDAAVKGDFSALFVAFNCTDGQVHRDVDIKPVAQETNNTIYQIQQDSASLDASTQAPWDAYIHSMAAPFQSADDALQERDNRIAMNLALAVSRLSPGQPRARARAPYTLFLANALHTVTDSTSPAHMDNGVPITWPSLPNVFEHGDESGSIETWDNMTPELM